MHANILHNSDLIPNDRHTASVGQVGLLNGWGVFSTIRVLDGVLFAWERHWARMARDAAYIKVPMPPSGDALRADLERLVQANAAAHATLRVVVVRNKGGLFQAPHLERDYDVVAYTVDLHDWGVSARLGVQENGRFAANPMSGLKLTSWSQNLAMLESAQARAFDEVVLLNERGEVSECTSANIFAVRGARVVTPRLNSGCLPGVTRQVLLEEIAVEGVTLAEETLTLDDLYQADGVFLTSSTRELLPVASIEGRATGRQDTVRARLHEAFRAYMRRYADAVRASRAQPRV